MNIAHYSYDSIGNPYCAGGGAYRALMVHKNLPDNFDVKFYLAKYGNIKSHEKHGIEFHYLGAGKNYLISRIFFTIAANIHSLFVKSDLIVIEFSAYSPIFTFLFKPKRTIIQFHHFMDKEPLKKYGIFGLFAWVGELIALRWARNIITPAEGTAKSIRKKYGMKKNLYFGYNGVDQSLFNKDNIDKKFILSFGRIDIRMKGLDILIPSYESIAESFPDYKLIIAGRGAESDLNWLKKRTKNSSQRNKIQLIIDVEEDKKKELLRSATFVCLPSRFEGWSIVAIETAANSKAVIGTQIGGLKETIKHNETGILVPAEDTNALADAMRLLLNDKHLRIKLGNNGFAWAQNFTWERVSKIQENLYLKVIKELN